MWKKNRKEGKKIKGKKKSHANNQKSPRYASHPCHEHSTLQNRAGPSLAPLSCTPFLLPTALTPMGTNPHSPKTSHSSLPCLGTSGTPQGRDPRRKGPPQGLGQPPPAPYRAQGHWGPAAGSGSARGGGAGAPREVFILPPSLPAPRPRPAPPAPPLPCPGGEKGSRE